MTDRSSWIMLGAALLFATATAAEATEVDCTNGETIADALRGKGRTVAIKGICDGEPDNIVTIQRDDVTLTGITEDAAVHGLVVVDGAQRAVIENLTITAPLYAIDVINGGSATIRNNRIVDNEELGISVINGSFATIEFNEIADNGEVGISSFRGATVRSRENSIAGHSFSGVEVAQHSAFISQPRRGMPGDVITAPDREIRAVTVARHSYGDLRDVAIVGGIHVATTSELDIRGRDVTATVDGDFFATTLSTVLKNGSRAGVVVNGSCTTMKTSYCEGAW